MPRAPAKPVVTSEQKAALDRADALRDRRDWWAESYAFAAAGAFLVSLALLGYECLRWLQTGTWDPLRSWHLATVIDQNWLINPTSWLGVHKILIWVFSSPMFLIYPALGWIIAATVGVTIYDHFEKALKNHCEKHGIPEERPRADSIYQ